MEITLDLSINIIEINHVYGHKTQFALYFSYKVRLFELEYHNDLFHFFDTIGDFYMFIENLFNKQMTSEINNMLNSVY